MARTATTTDAFNAIAEERRRDILEFLAGEDGGERPVNDIVQALGLAQPQVSKHLRVLREVELVNVRGSGRHRLYSVNGERLKPVHEWTKLFERFWDNQLKRIKERAEREADAAQRAPGRSARSKAPSDSQES